jgi:hypothetical protein
LASFAAGAGFDGASLKRFRPLLYHSFADIQAGMNSGRRFTIP